MSKKNNESEKCSIFRVMVARVRHTTHEQLVKLAEQDTELSGRQIYVADLVRDAIKIYLRERIVPKSVLDGQDTSHTQLTYKN